MTVKESQEFIKHKFTKTVIFSFGKKRMECKAILTYVDISMAMREDILRYLKRL